MLRVFLRVQVGINIGAPEFVNRLLGIADQVQILAGCCKDRRKNEPLAIIGILKFID